MKKILLLFLVMVLSLGLIGCGAATGESPEQAVKNAIDAIKAGDSEKASVYMDYDKLLLAGDEENDDTTEQSKKMAQLILNHLDYKILSSSEEGDTATVRTEITNIDMSKVMADFISQLVTLAFSGLSEEQLDEKCIEIYTDLINQENNKTVTNTVDIKLSKHEGKWTINWSDDLADAFMGGLLSYSEEMKDSFGGDSGN